MFKEQRKIKPPLLVKGGCVSGLCHFFASLSSSKRYTWAFERQAGDKGAANSAQQRAEQVFPFPWVPSHPASQALRSHQGQT